MSTPAPKWRRRCGQPARLGFRELATTRSWQQKLIHAGLEVPPEAHLRQSVKCGQHGDVLIEVLNSWLIFNNFGMCAPFLNL